MADILRFPSAVKHDPAIDAWLAAQQSGRGSATDVGRLKTLISHSIDAWPVVNGSCSTSSVQPQWHPGFDASSLAWTRYDHAVAVDEFEPLADRHQPNPAARNRTLRIEADPAIDDLQTNLGGGAAHRHPDLACARVDDRVDRCFL